MKVRILTVGFTVLLLIVMFSGCIEENPKLIYVDDDGGADYTQIQKAIDDASDGDTIFVHNGTYYETLIINKSINLIGASKDKTIIDFQNTNKINQNNIVFIEADNCTIKELKIIGIGTTDSDTVGISINASYNTISNNIILNNYKGVNIGEDTKNNDVSWNTVSNNWYGIATRHSDNNNISKNNISLSGLYGIYLSVSETNIIFGNTVSYCDFYGMRIKASDNNKVFNNIVAMNKRGMYLCCGAGNNIIYYNTFKQNSEWNARDDVVNQWDNGSFGNYWDDYTGLDNDSDGIGDIPYNISGGNNQDRYPLMNQFNV
ncbi:MAG: right-handed parallel beta-helix repeat-containing protein [Thermoplasmatales archaeon]|nr:MAG: right-handed parallel beta-helix repeat-containing protein [Thermoplasmatales archaeon]